jgi:hypothetical protein
LSPTIGPLTSQITSLFCLPRISTASAQKIIHGIINNIKCNTCFIAVNCDQTRFPVMLGDQNMNRLLSLKVFKLKTIGLTINLLSMLNVASLLGLIFKWKRSQRTVVSPVTSE